MKTYNAALQAQLDAYLSEQSGLPQSKAAAMIGVSPTALSQYRNSKYPGDVEAVESKIEEFLRTRSAAAQAEAEKAPYLSAGYVPTSVSEDVYKAIQYCQLERGIVVLHGDAGIGKTRGAARFVQDNPANAIYIRCTPVGGTLTAMLRQLGTALKLPATRNRLELSMAIHDRLKGTDKVIIIDEAQNLTPKQAKGIITRAGMGTKIILLGDPQGYTKYDINQPLFDLCTAWIADNVDHLNIKAVLCTGDLVEQNETAIPLAFRKTDQTSAEQWRAASRAFERLDNKLPYVVCTGNHDYGYTKSENRLSRFPDYFPMTRNECWRHKIVSVCNNAHGIPTLENAAYEFHTDTWGDLLVVSLEFAPRDEAIEWARKLVAEPRYANTRVILLTHSFIAWKGNRKKTEPYELTDANYQQAIWDKLVYPSSNIRLVICGHECHPTTDYFETVGFRTDKNAAGKSVAQMMFNAQTADGQWHGNGGDCWLRILEFLPDGRTVSVRTFSPMFALSPVTCDKAWRTADYDQFTFDME